MNTYYNSMSDLLKGAIQLCNEFTSGYLPLWHICVFYNWIHLYLIICHSGSFRSVYLLFYRCIVIRITVPEIVRVSSIQELSLCTSSQNLLTGFYTTG